MKMLMPPKEKINPASDSANMKIIRDGIQYCGIIYQLWASLCYVPER
jgi:hypothetical protein